MYKKHLLDTQKILTMKALSYMEAVSCQFFWYLVSKCDHCCDWNSQRGN